MQVPDLVDATGRLRNDLGRLGLDLALRPRARRQIAAEITAQFEAFRGTGLRLDHVNAHKHFHIHPLIGGVILDIGRRYGMRSLRVPREPASVIRRVEREGEPGFAFATAPWAALLRARARRAGVATPEAVFGLAWSGAMTESRLAGLLARLPPGLTEIYTHPAMAGGFEGHAPGYRYADELVALVAPASRNALRASGASTGGYEDFLSAGA